MLVYAACLIATWPCTASECIKNTLVDDGVETAL